MPLHSNLLLDLKTQILVIFDSPEARVISGRCGVSVSKPYQQIDKNRIFIKIFVI